MRPPIKTNFAGQTFRAVGSRLFWGKPTETDHEFYIRVLQFVFKPGWYHGELKKTLGEQHIVAQWYQSWCNWRRDHAKDENLVDGQWSAIPSGDSWSLLTLGFDLYCLMHCSSLPSKLVYRLKQKSSFQGARYELAVASIFVRLDYKLKWLKDKENKSCEFIATHELSGEMLSVEVKSRHRSGVLHEPGAQRTPEEVKIGITGLLNQALQQNPKNTPFVIFIDLNLPATGVPPPETAWWEDLKKAVTRQGPISETCPEEFAALFVTNFSYHYEGRNLLNASKNVGSYGVVIPRFSSIPFRRVGNMSNLINAVENYGTVPRFDEFAKSEDPAKQISLVSQMATYLFPRSNVSKLRPPAITAILTCGDLRQNGSLLDLRQVGHKLFSRSGSGAINIWIYVEGHWFQPGEIEIKIEIADADGAIVADPPAYKETVSEDGILEIKLLLENCLTFRPGRYEITVNIKDGPSATTELIMLA